MIADKQTIITEDVFLNQLQLSDIPWVDLLDAVKTVAANNPVQAESWAGMLQESLRERSNLPAALTVLQFRMMQRIKETSIRTTCVGEAAALFGASPDRKVYLENVGFENKLPIPECFRRLQVLCALAPGKLCYDKTWGVGVIKRVDPFYKRVEVDFERKPGHQLSIAYAAESLELLADDHILARKYREPEVVVELILKKPDEVVRMALRSFGQLSINQLQEIMVSRVLGKIDWKKYWDSARKELKKDPLVEIPSRRNDPIRLLENVKGFDDKWLQTLSCERDMERLLTMLEDFLADEPDQETVAKCRTAISERLTFVLKGASGYYPSWVAQALEISAELGVEPHQLNTSELWAKYLQSNVFVEAIAHIPAREIPRFLRHLHGRSPEATVKLLVETLPRLGLTALNETVDLLMELGQDAECGRVFNELTAVRQEADVEILLWLLKHPDSMSKWMKAGLPDLARWILRALEKEHTGDKLKTKNQLRVAFEKKEWLQTVLEQMTEGERRDLMLQIKDSPGWAAVDKRSLLGALIKMCPELQAVMAGEDSKKNEAAIKTSITSWRSYHERQRQLEKIVKQEIPEVAKEIGVARSYGDLRENFEYKAAKDKQALLVRRRAELEDMLQQVRPTDFAITTNEQITAGTSVKIRLSDGREQHYNILGAWDQEEKMGIIPCDSRMAQALQGHKAGEMVNVPSDVGEQMATIIDVGTLSDEIRSWIKGTEQ